MRICYLLQFVLLNLKSPKKKRELGSILWRLYLQPHIHKTKLYGVQARNQSNRVTYREFCDSCEYWVRMLLFFKRLFRYKFFSPKKRVFLGVKNVELQFQIIQLYWLGGLSRYFQIFRSFRGFWGSLVSFSINQSYTWSYWFERDSIP